MAYEVQITTFGFLHGDPPDAHLTIDLRHHFRDPHVSPDLRYKTARDPEVREAVWNTPGIPRVIDGAALAVLAFLEGPSAGPVTVAVGCAGGRHRAASVGEELAEVLSNPQWREITRGNRSVSVTVTHRDLDKDVVNR